MKYFSFAILISVCNLSSASQPVQTELSDVKKKFNSSASEQKKADYEKGIQYVAESGLLDSAIQVGDTAPDFQLNNAVDEPVLLSSLLQNGPVIITWYRGGWCPYCNIYLRGLQQRLPEIEAAGAQLVAITPELPDNALSTTEKHQLSFHVLSDIGNKVASEYGVVFTLPDYVIQHYDLSFSLPEYNGDESYTLPLSASYVIDQQGLVKYAYLDADYRNRAPIDEIINTLK